MEDESKRRDSCEMWALWMSRLACAGSRISRLYTWSQHTKQRIDPGGSRAAERSEHGAQGRRACVSASELHLLFTSDAAMSVRQTAYWHVMQEIEQEVSHGKSFVVIVLPPLFTELSWKAAAFYFPQAAKLMTPCDPE